MDKIEDIDYKPVVKAQEQTLKQLAKMLEPWCEGREAFLYPISISNKTNQSLHINLEVGEQNLTLSVIPRSPSPDETTLVVPSGETQDVDMGGIYEYLRRQSLSD